MKKKLITSALPYVNNVPHLGNIIGCVLSADVYARYCRLKGYETLYVCGTDEYGTATENKAREEGMSPREICDKYFELHKQVYQNFNISFDIFGRTSTDEQTQIAHQIFKDVDRNGYISKKTSERTYCSEDDIFLADRYVEGTCPKCQAPDARGDQCDACGSLLEPEKLVEPKCKICGSRPVLKSTSHLYLDLNKLQPVLEKWFKKASVEGKWTVNAVNTTQSWINRGLDSRPITRDLKWGIPVPKAGFENKVFYVWFDAPIGYISITSKEMKNWKEWWMNPKEVELFQFMAKDNIPFHTIIFPASLLGSGQDWTLLHHINSTEYLNYEDTKFSKSREIGVFGTDVVKTGIHVDLWRFYLLALRPESTDTSFSWKDFFGKINYEFLDNIGNLVNRVLVYLKKNFNSEIKDYPLSAEGEDFVKECKKKIEQISENFESVNIRETLRLILMLSKSGNKYFQDSAPWALIKEDRNKAHAVITSLVYLIKNLAILLYPFIPETSERLFKMLNFTFENQDKNLWDELDNYAGLDGVKINEPEILHQKLDMNLVEKWKKRFSGQFKDFSVLNIKVARINKVEKHPNADRLYKLTVDLGEGQERTLCAGLVSHFKPEELLDQKALVLSNLKPAELRGVMSEGMILTAEKKKKLDIYDLTDLEVGYTLAPDNLKEPNEKQITIDDFAEVEIAVKDGMLCYENEPLLFNKKPLRTRILQNGKVR